MADQALIDERKQLTFRLQQLRCLYQTVDGCHREMIRDQIDNDLQLFELVTKQINISSIFEGPPPPRVRNRLHD
jgi:hypothetical protein